MFYRKDGDIIFENDENENFENNKPLKNTDTDNTDNKNCSCNCIGWIVVVGFLAVPIVIIILYYIWKVTKGLKSEKTDTAKMVSKVVGDVVEEVVKDT